MNSITHFLSNVQPYLEQYGLFALFAGVFLESLGLPVPGETIIILAGALAGDGRLSIAAVGLTAFFAAVLGDNLGYAIGRYGGRPLLLQYGGQIGVTHERLKKVEWLLLRHGSIIVAGARFVVLLRQLNGLAAGTAKMPWHRFLLANGLGAALWVGLWSSLAYNFGQQLSIIGFWKAHLSLVAAIVIPGLIIAIVVALWFRRRNS